MASRFQAALLAAAPSYPNSIAWSDENLLAVAAGHIVAILNPASPNGPRGLVMVPPSRPFPIGLIPRQALLSACLLPTSLSRDCRPCVRSISWSPLGLSPNGGCLLAVCTVEGHVKLYRPPFCEFRAEWIELMDLSDMLFEYLAYIEFGESSNSEMLSCPSTSYMPEGINGPGCEDDLPIGVLKKKSKRRKINTLQIENENIESFGHELVHTRTYENVDDASNTHTRKLFTAVLEEKIFPCSTSKEYSSIEVYRLDGSQHVWVVGFLESLIGSKALVTFTETDGKQGEPIEIDIDYGELSGSNLPKRSVVRNHFPKVRPFMNGGNLPEELVNFQGVEEILNSGQGLEAWINERWVEGSFMGFHKDHLLVKLHGDCDSVLLHPKSVRLAPVWVCRQKSWKLNIIKTTMDSQKSPEVVELNSNIEDINHLQLVPITKSKVNSQKNILVDCTSPQITADQYASRSAMLSSTVSAWSPLLQFSSDSGQVSSNSSSNCCSLLAFGGKSGKISFWRINGPGCYSIEQSKVNPATLVGLLSAHAAWITTISWAVLASEVSNPQFLLATGSSDGSVKIWRVSSDELLKSSEMNHAYFLLVNEVSSVGAIPVSVLSLTVPIEQQKILLAIGRVSGSFDVWSSDLSTGKLDNVSSEDAHDHVVTGLAWAFDGTCLYSCSQDNTVRRWILHESSLYEAPFHSSTLGVKTSPDIPTSSDSCFGVDASPGNLVIAVVRKFDVECLHPMYQARTMKAVVEFFWIGGQQSGHELNSNPEIGIENFPVFSENELVYWESNILRSLSNYEHADRPLVVWDMIAALLAFKVSAPKYVEQILLRWLSMSFVESDFGLPTEQVLSHTSRSFPKVSSRRLQLVNVICRRLMLPELQTDLPNRKKPDLGHCGAKEEQMTFWMELISSCERELRERVVGFNMSAAFCHLSCSASTVSKIRYYPSGIAQMKHWIDLNHDDVQDKQKYYAGKHVARLQTARGYVEEEKCCYCSASVPFESPEVAFCQGVNGQRHKFVRCAVSMRACPPTPLWFCTCCKRWAWQLAPEALLAMPEHPSDFESYLEHSNMSAFSKPLCPFCGILLQRSQPEFLLSASPV